MGSFLFILIQLILFIDFAHSWNQRWLCKAEECDSPAWYAGQCHAGLHTEGLGVMNRGLELRKFGAEGRKRLIMRSCLRGPEGVEVSSFYWRVCTQQEMGWDLSVVIHML